MPGRSYLIRFFYSPRPDAGNQLMGVYWNGQQIGTAGGVGSPGLHWQEKTFSVISSGNLGILGFGSIQSLYGAGNLIDSVSVKLLPINGSCVPQPPTLAVFCSASPNPVNTNQQVSFSAFPSGGTGSYTYSWTGACQGSSQTCANSFASQGSYSSTVFVNSGDQTTSNSCSVQVNQVQIPQCQDNIDNDLDGAVDYPNDFSCGSASDNDETFPKAQCQDGVDNDSDGLIDYLK